MTRTIHVPSGIGDNIWIAQKLLNTNERFRFLLPNAEPLRGKSLYDILPNLTHECLYSNITRYPYIKQHNIQKRIPYWKGITSRRINNFMLEVNTWLESGNRIENFMPDLETSYRIEYETTLQDKDYASKLISNNKTVYMGIFATSYSTSRAWGFWTHEEWVKLISLIYKKDPSYVFVIIGANWDTDMGFKMMSKLDELKIPYINTIGTLLGGTVEILKRLDYFIGFPSGLSILYETLGLNGLMFYPEHLKDMMYSWADPKRLKDESHKPMLFTTPEKCFDWIKTEVL